MEDTEKEVSIQERCALCDSQDVIDGEAKEFYKIPICGKCQSSLVNRRVVAYILDILICGIVAGLIIGFLDGFLGWNLSESETDGISRVLGALLFFFKDGFTGTSPGKKLTKLRVVDADTNKPIGFGQSFKRNLPLIIPFVPLVVAFELKNGKRIGDGWANTKVVWGKLVKDEPKDKDVGEESRQDLEEPNADSDNSSHINKKRKMKKCPFCGEKIFAEAIKCQYCKEFLDK